MDAIWNNGFTYAFDFRNEPVLNKYTDQGVSALNDQTQSMFDNIEHKYHYVWMDNIYNDYKFCKDA